jgi:hypothetical protein
MRREGPLASRVRSLAALALAPVPAIVESFPSSRTWTAKAAVLKAGEAGSTLGVTA